MNLTTFDRRRIRDLVAEMHSEILKPVGTDMAKVHATSRTLLRLIWRAKGMTDPEIDAQLERDDREMQAWQDAHPGYLPHEFIAWIHSREESE